MEKYVTQKKLKRKRKHGFFQRAKTHTGKNLIKRRKTAKRKRITV